MFSHRSSFDLAPNPLALALQRARASSRSLLDLTESNPTQAGLEYDAGALLAALAPRAALAYEPASFGLESARDAVARSLGIDGLRVEPGRVILTASTSEAYAFLFKLLCDPGDEVLVPRPSYPLFDHLAQLEGVRAVPYRLAYDGAWHVDAASLRESVGARTRAVVTVSPNNPTGSYLKRDELELLASTGLPLVSDEVFARYPLREDARRARSALEGPSPLVFSLGGLSKLAGLPQLKLAWTVVGGEPGPVAQAMARLEVIADAFLSVAAPVQHALPELLAAGRVTEAAIRERLRDNHAWLVDACRAMPVSLLDAEGGWYTTLQLPGVRSEEAWALTLLEEDGIQVHPGHFFDFEREPYAVISLLTPQAIFREGVRRLLARAALA
jgi:aspartate/methionine/tyrosine aminotransferase